MFEFLGISQPFRQLQGWSCMAQGLGSGVGCLPFCCVPQCTFRAPHKGANLVFGIARFVRHAIGSRQLGRSTDHMLPSCIPCLAVLVCDSVCTSSAFVHAVTSGTACLAALCSQQCTRRPGFKITYVASTSACCNHQSAAAALLQQHFAGGVHGIRYHQGCGLGQVVPWPVLYGSLTPLHWRSNCKGLGLSEV